MNTNRPARPYWTGFLKLSLVTCGVRLYTAATDKDRVKFNLIHEPTGERVRQQMVVPGHGPVERHEIVKGFEYERGRYVTVDPEDLKRLKLDSTDTIDITEFVADIDIDPVYYDAPYYLLPEGGASEQGYRVIREALRASGMVAIGQVVIGGHERVVAIRAMGSGLLVNTLRYRDELRDPEEYFGSIAEAPVDADEVAMMETIIARKLGGFDPAKYVDHYAQALRDLIKQKLAGAMPAETLATRAVPSSDLMAALKASLAAEAPGGDDWQQTGQEIAARYPKTLAKLAKGSAPEPAKKEKPAKGRRKREKID